MFFVGTLMGPLHHYYYVYLDKLMPRADAKTAIKKIMCDQAFASPATIIFFFYGMGLLEKKTLAQSTEELKEKFLYVYMVSCLQHLFLCFASEETTIYLQFFFSISWPSSLAYSKTCVHLEQSCVIIFI